MTTAAPMCPLCNGTGRIAADCTCCATLRHPFFHLQFCEKMIYPSGFRPCEGIAHAKEAK